MDNEEKFSNDPEENMRIENDFIKLKLKAQFGDAFMMGGNGDLPPEIENQFLKNIMAFEEAHQNAERITVYEQIGKPNFRNIEDLTGTEITNSLKAIMNVMEKNDVILTFSDGPYPDDIIYEFITTELFDLEIDKVGVKGMAYNFIYEEFYPNDHAEIERHTHGFLKEWFAQGLCEYSTEIGFHFISPDGNQLTKEQLLKKTQYFFDAYSEFKNDGYNIDEIKFEVQEDGNFLGHSEGTLTYDAVLESGEIIKYQGPYKLYMLREDNWWSIFYFVMPGFVW